ncbi:hypothetical protein BsWGS_16971 [Bradybaena similaris]
MLSPPPYPATPTTSYTSVESPQVPLQASPQVPGISPQISPRISPQISPRISPQISPRISPQTSPPTPESQLTPTLSQASEPESPIIAGPNPLVRDNNFSSLYVMSLKEYNFDKFICTKEKALVYFYNTDAPPDRVLEAQFAEAANKTYNTNYGFGAVDCLFNHFLCDDEKITTSPALKLFSNGFQLSTFDVPRKFTADQMRMLMKMTPILTQPRVELGKEYLARGYKKPKKKRSLLCC